MCEPTHGRTGSPTWSGIRKGKRNGPFSFSLLPSGGRGDENELAKKMQKGDVKERRIISNRCIPDRSKNALSSCSAASMTKGEGGGENLPPSFQGKVGDRRYHISKSRCHRQMRYEENDARHSLAEDCCISCCLRRLRGESRVGATQRKKK